MQRRTIIKWRNLSNLTQSHSIAGHVPWQESVHLLVFHYMIRFNGFPYSSVSTPQSKYCLPLSNEDIIKWRNPSNLTQSHSIVGTVPWQESVHLLVFHYMIRFNGFPYSQVFPHLKQNIGKSSLLYSRQYYSSPLG